MTKIYEPDYDPINHLYYDDSGNRLEGVTDILQGELGGFSGFPESAALRGTAVHNAIQFYTEQDLDETTLSPEISGYLECFKRAQDFHKIKILQNEIKRYHPKYLYAGRCDAVVEIDGERGIIDYKSGAPSGKRDCWQLSSYLEMLKSEIPMLTGRWNLYLKPGGYSDGFKLVKHTGHRDFLEFLALFSAYQIKKNEGYIKERRKITQ